MVQKENWLIFFVATLIIFVATLIIRLKTIHVLGNLRDTEMLKLSENIPEPVLVYIIEN